MSEIASPEPQPEMSSEEAVGNLIRDLQSKQNFTLAIIAATASALIGAALWAGITIATEYQIGFMAVGVGALVGFAVRVLGKGIDQKFGFLGAVFALIGCLLGNLFTQVGFAAIEFEVGFLDILLGLNGEMIVEVFASTFSPMDLLFYGLAVYAGFKFSFHQLNDDQLAELQS